MAGERLETLKVYRVRYGKAASRPERTKLLDEFCEVSGYHRKYAIGLLKRLGDETGPGRRRGVTYSAEALQVVEKVWEAAGYLWSERLVALLPLWLPWACKHMRGLMPAVEQEVLTISARQLREKKRTLKYRLYGRTKPGTLLKHQIEIKTTIGTCTSRASRR